MTLPDANSDLWVIFWRVLDLVELEECSFCWVPAHVDPARCEGLSRLIALGNDLADRTARGLLQVFIGSLPFGVSLRLILSRSDGDQLSGTFT